MSDINGESISRKPKGRASAIERVTQTLLVAGFAAQALLGLVTDANAAGVNTVTRPTVEHGFPESQAEQSVIRYRLGTWVSIGNGYQVKVDRDWRFDAIFRPGRKGGNSPYAYSLYLKDPNGSETIIPQSDGTMISNGGFVTTVWQIGDALVSGNSRGFTVE